MPHDWKQLALYSHYQTTVAMHEDLQAGHMEDALAGLEECIEASSRSDERALKSSLVLVPPLTWAEVFETPYELDEEQPSVAYELAREQSHGRGSQRPCR